MVVLSRCAVGSRVRRALHGPARAQHGAARLPAPHHNTMRHNMTDLDDESTQRRLRVSNMWSLITINTLNGSIFTTKEFLQMHAIMNLYNNLLKLNFSISIFVSSNINIILCHMTYIDAIWYITFHLPYREWSAHRQHHISRAYSIRCCHKQCSKIGSARVGAFDRCQLYRKRDVNAINKNKKI